MMSKNPLTVMSPDSTASKTSSSSPASTRGSAAVKAAAKSFAGIFVACLTPPEYEDETRNSREHNSAPYGETGRSRGGNLRHGSSPRIGDLKFTMDQIYNATRNFSTSLKIGQGGFATVYKGTLEDGTVVAVKRARKSVFSSKNSVLEFQRETQLLAQVEHLNLVRQYGFLEEGDEKILVVEYVSNGTLRHHLDGRRGNGLDFAARLDVMIDVAHALTYLHTYTDHPIIHRDIKSSNILLADNLRAKVADFGFARLAAARDSGATHVSTQIKGTAGYLDPEYMKTYQLTEKSDVYSYGALLVELVTGRRPIEPKRDLKERVTVKWAMSKFIQGDAVMTLDPRLERNPQNIWALKGILQLALQCVGSRRDDRPSMNRCAEILWSIRKEYSELSAIEVSSCSSQSRWSNSAREEE